MPLHDFRCAAGHVHDAFVGHGVNLHDCPCGLTADKVFLTAPMGFVQRDICYDSPIDGKPITNKHARREDLRRNDCVEWDPGMKQDAERKRAEVERSLDQGVERSVDEFFATAGTRKLEKLEAEVRAGADARIERASPAPVEN